MGTVPTHRPALHRLASIADKAAPQRGVTSADISADTGGKCHEPRIAWNVPDSKLWFLFYSARSDGYSFAAKCCS